MSPRIEKLKQHVTTNRTAYSAGVSCLVVGILIGAACKDRPINIVNTIAPIFNNNNSSSVDLSGYAQKLVRCNETGQIWESVKNASAAVGVTPSVLSKVLNGHTDHVKGLTYSIVGLGTTAI